MATTDKQRTFEDQFYVEDQVLITGPVREIGEVVAQVSDELGVDLKPAGDEKRDLWRLQWERAGDHMWGCLEDILPDLSECLKGPLEMQLYSIRQQGQVQAVVRSINRAGGSLCVRADPNYLVGYPYSAAGSPYSAAGSPYSAAGSPFTKHGGPVGPGDFWNQWALEKIGLSQNGRWNTRRGGQGVRVGVFDTSPFAAGGTPVPAGEGHPTLLTVVHPEVFEHFPVPPPPPAQSERGETPPDPPDLSAHGLSVAGLAYAVAPRSDIYLYRVLDKHARGNLFVLCCALIEFMDGVLSAQDAPNGGIINLSLGLPLPADWRTLVGTESVFALEIVLALAHCQGLTVVAAAGNASPGLDPAADAEFPASQSYTIGVMASNYDDDRSCFSNKGDLAAPGGDGYDCGREDEECKCPWEIEEIERWRYGLIGPVLPCPQFPQGLARWIGTSFATPLVSGLAALILEHSGGLPQAGMRSEILDDAKPGGSEIVGGIINLPGYLQALP